MNPILGRYRIVGEIGQGAMGTVYKAVDPVIDRTVAIKTINLNLSKEELDEYEARFRQEIKVAGRLNHPNIVTIFDVGKTEEIAYMAMEFLEGRELKDIMAAGTRPPVEQVVDIMAQVADGLWFAHRQEIVHRDVKPSNVMVLEDGVAKITDFGIARLPNSAVKTMTGMILGSPRYMSPEQVIGKELDARTDIFSLGVVLYEALTGEAPFDGDNVSAIMYATVNTTPLPPSTKNRDVPPMLDLIVVKAMAKQVDERYQTMKELRDDLREVARQLPPLPAIEMPKAQPAPSADVPSPVQAATAIPAAGHLDKNTLREEGPVGPLKLDKSFDSFDATLRLAAMTEQIDEFEDYITTTQKMRAYHTADTRKSRGEGESSTGPVPSSSERVPSSSGRMPSSTSRTLPPRSSPAQPEPLFPETQGSNLAALLVIAVLAVAALALLVALLK